MGRRAKIWDKPNDLRTEEQERWRESMNKHFMEWERLDYPIIYRNYRPYRGNTEQRKEQAKIIRHMIEHPFDTYTEVAKKFNRDRKSISQILSRYPKIAAMINEKRDKEILDMYEDVLYDIAEITHKNIGKYKESDEKLRTTELKDLSTIAKETQERKNLIEGKPTENQNINITFN